LLRDLYDWIMRMAAHRQAPWVLAVVSFAESSFFPIPPDPMLAAMAIAKPKRAWVFAAICSVASVAGGYLGYAIGYFLIETIGKWVIDLYGLQSGFAQFRHWYDEWGVWVILVKGLLPIPYKIVTITSGAVQFDILAFGITSLITRAGRFFLVAALFKVFGPSIQHFVEKHLTLVTTALAVLLVGGFVALKYL
jgi:membrane protein YqaA with SNARE-associated domain